MKTTPATRRGPRGAARSAILSLYLLVVALAGCGTQPLPTEPQSAGPETLPATIVDEPQTPTTTEEDEPILPAEVDPADSDPVLPAADEPEVHAPVAVAGDSVGAAPGDEVQLDGSSSYDDDGDVLAYEWVYVTGDPPITLEGGTDAVAYFVVPAVERETTLDFMLVVSDGRFVDRDEVSVFVQPGVVVASEGPVANAGPDVEASVGDEVTLDGSGSTADSRSTLHYLWSQVSGPSVSLSATDQAVVTFQTPAAAAGARLVFELAVFSNGISAIDDVVVTVAEVEPVIAPAGGGGGGGGGSSPEPDPTPDPECTDDEDCDDGFHCNGAETCSSGTCVAGRNPCPDSRCNEVTDSCVECLSHMHCIDSEYCNGIELCIDGACTPGTDPCDGLTCDEVADTCVDCTDDNECDDGNFCNGAEACLGGNCVSGGDPCPAQMCDESGDVCVDCLVDGDCDDGAYCNGYETCEAGVCQAAGDPCAGQMCDEVADSCVDCLGDGDCDDDVFCNGAESCLGGSCVSGSDPCPGQMCDESGDACVECLDDTDCSDGQFCNGSESCDGGACAAGTPPCTGQLCDEDGDTCQSVDCFEDEDCDDGVFCNGAETCDGNTCVNGSYPCGALYCDGGNQACVECRNDDDCDDGSFCNGAESCSDGLCVAGSDPCPDSLCHDGVDACVDCLEHADCADSSYCNGLETCVDGTCQAGSDPCPGEMCDESGDTCVACLGDEDCDDGAFCNGSESCVLGVCRAGDDPCPGQMCDEDGEACVDCLDDGDCDDGAFCTGTETCADGTCHAGSDPCPGETCDEVDDTCTNCVTSTTAWRNTSFSPQSGKFSVQFEATPQGNNILSHTTLGSGAGTTYADYAILIGFGPSGLIDVRNGDGYGYEVAVPYSSGTSYSFELAIDVDTHTYSVYVTPQGGSRLTLAANYSFHQNHVDVASLDHWAVRSGDGAHELCAFSLHGPLNQPPVVDAGAPADTELPAATVSLNGTVTDDGLPAPPASVTSTWSQTSGPGTATFANTSGVDTDVSFDAAGSYTLRLTASDGASEAYDEVMVTVDAAPQPELAVSSESLDFGSATQNVPIEIWNAGSGTLYYTVDEDVAWLTVSSQGGESSGEHDNVLVSVDRSGVAEGTHQGEITVTATGLGTSVTVLVTMTVSAAGALPMQTASHTEGVAPLAVFFDAVNDARITGHAPGVVQPADGDYASYQYEWNFGDPAAGTWSKGRRLQDGSYPSKNLATGHIAGHVFETPGQYTVTLRVTDTSGAQTRYEQQIEVKDLTTQTGADAWTTYYVSSSMGLDSNTGLSDQAPFASFNKAMSMLGPRVRVLFRRGDTWTISNGVTFNQDGPTIIGAYGSGARPRIVATTDADIFHAYHRRDWMFLDLDLVGALPVSGGACIRRLGFHNLVARCSISNSTTGIAATGLGGAAHAFLYETDISGTYLHGSYIAYVPGDSRCYAILGCTFSASSTSHLLRTFVAKLLVGNCTFEQGASGEHLIKMCGPDTASCAADYNILSDNLFTNVGNSAWLISMGPENTVSDQTVSHVLLERNTWDVGDVSGRCHIQSRGANHVTIRNNLFVGGANPILASHPMPGFSTWNDWRIYNNTYYRSRNEEVVFLSVEAPAVATNWRVSNNIISVPNTSNVRVIAASDSPRAAFTFDHNIWHVPACTNSPLFSVSDANRVSFSVWQQAGMDTASSMADPLFCNPTGGDYRLRCTGDGYPTNSPGLNAGIALPHVRQDFHCQNRSGLSYDLGVFERVP